MRLDGPKLLPKLARLRKKLARPAPRSTALNGTRGQPLAVWLCSRRSLFLEPRRLVEATFLNKCPESPIPLN